MGVLLSSTLFKYFIISYSQKTCEFPFIIYLSAFLIVTKYAQGKTHHLGHLQVRGPGAVHSRCCAAPTLLRL